jgi:hypothetical protein
MACFLAPAGVAIVTTVVQRVVKKKEETATADRTEKSIGKWTQRLRWLNTMLWGGVILLALEHIWHGEVVPWPPFLTAMQTPGEVGPMLREIATYGVAMTVVVIVVWAIMVAIAELRSKARNLPELESKPVGGGE